MPGEFMDALEKKADGKHAFVFVTIASLDDYFRAPDMHTAKARWKGNEVFGFPYERTPCLTIQFPAANPILPMWAEAQPTWTFASASVLGYVELAPESAGRALARQLRGEWIKYKEVNPRVFDVKEAGDPDAPYTRLRFIGNLPEEINLVLLAGPAFDDVDHHFAIFQSNTLFYPLVAIWLVACSYLSGGLAGLIVRRQWSTFANLGLWNLGTIIALSLRAARVRWHDPNANFTTTRRRLFLLSFTAIFTGINYFAAQCLTYLLGHYTPWR